MTEEFPDHEGSLCITHNGHKDFHEDILTYIRNSRGAGIRGFDPTEWVSREDFENAVSQNDLWEVTWYPDNPITFFRTRGSTLENALIKAKEVIT